MVDNRAEIKRQKMAKEISNRVNNYATKEHARVKEHVQTRPDLDAEIAHLWREIARLSRENNSQAEQLRNLSKK